MPGDRLGAGSILGRPAPYMQGQLATRVAGVLDRDGLMLRITLSWREERAGGPAKGKGGERGNRKRERVRLVMRLSKIVTSDVVGPDGNGRVLFLLSVPCPDTMDRMGAASGK